MFEIVQDHIAKLDDTGLRILVAKLCSAELHLLGISSAALSYGGNQDASDGGSDVEVTAQIDVPLDCWVPRKRSVFQAKKSNMPPGKIRNEMRPRGIIRPLITSLAGSQGAYILVSSTSCTGKAINSRTAAMRAAVADVEGSQNLDLRYYDGTKLADWTQRHPGVGLWLRERIGSPLVGWRGYGSWAAQEKRVEDQYLLDETVRIIPDRVSPSVDGLSVLDGIQQLRKRLNQSGTSTRIIGLSGVGKTRLVQALFDQRIGQDALYQSLAAYADLQMSPNPSPIELVSQFISEQVRGIVIVDNCPSDMHGQLTGLCRSAGSQLSVLTIEYDIQEDHPQDTDVYVMLPASDRLIERLLRVNYRMSHDDSARIAEFSGGNARIAFSLASRLEKDEMISGLTDRQLLHRIFDQREARDESLYSIAQACSLVYSFDCENNSCDQDAELFRIGALIEQTPNSIYASLATLKQRGVLQRRSNWGAILPQAIAIRLADEALKRIHPNRIDQKLISAAPERLVQSLSRRLGQIATPESELVGKRILQSHLADLPNLNDTQKRMLTNIAPCAPEVVLTAIEQAASTVEATADWVDLDLIYLLAYEGNLFGRAMRIAIDALANSGEISDNSRYVTEFARFFQLYFSGTHAPFDQKLMLIRSLLAEASPAGPKLGCLALTGALESMEFIVTHPQSFGTRRRDHGFRPRGKNDAITYYVEALGIVKEFGLGQSTVATEVRLVLAKQLERLWRQGGLEEELSSVCILIGQTEIWPEGWLATRDILRRYSDSLSRASLESLRALEGRLRPTNLIDKVHSVVLTPDVMETDFDAPERNAAEESENRWDRSEQLARELGRDVAADPDTFAAVLPHLPRGRHHRSFAFGQGLAEVTLEPEATWFRLVDQFELTPNELRNELVLRGFLNRLQFRDLELTHLLLDQSVSDPRLSSRFPSIQVGVDIDSHGVRRLLQSLRLDHAPVQLYRLFALGRALNAVSPDEFIALVRPIAAKHRGDEVALEILDARLHGDQRVPLQIASLGRELLIEASREASNYQLRDYHLGEVAKRCLPGSGGRVATRQICTHVKRLAGKRRLYPIQCRCLLQAVFTVQPRVALNTFLGRGRADSLSKLLRKVEAVEAIPQATLIEWCDENPGSRYAKVAWAISPTAGGDTSQTLTWTPTALLLLIRAPNRRCVLEAFLSEVLDDGAYWTPSLADHWGRTLSLLNQLPDFADSDFVNWTVEYKESMKRRIAEIRRSEAPRERNLGQRFE